MILYRSDLSESKKWMVVWDWPKGKMAWFFWNWHIAENSNATYWRVGPVTVSTWSR